jgi:hypothetical protein
MVSGNIYRIAVEWFWLSDGDLAGNRVVAEIA